MIIQKRLYLSGAALTLAGALALASPALARGASAGGGIGGSLGGGSVSGAVSGTGMRGGATANGGGVSGTINGSATRGTGSVSGSAGGANGSASGGMTITGSHIPSNIGASGSNAVVPASSLATGSTPASVANIGNGGGRGTRASGSLLSPQNGGATRTRTASGHAVHHRGTSAAANNNTAH